MAGTIQQIAELAGVSRGTVDRVLNNRGRVTAEVTAKVEQIVQELGYSPKPRKKAKSSTANNLSRRWRLGVITQLSQSSFMIEVNRGLADIQEQLKRRGFRIILKENATMDETEQLNALDELEQVGIDALAIMPVDSNSVRDRLGQMAREKDIPVVTFNTDIAGTGRSCFVGLDNRKSGRTAAGLMGMLTGGSGKVLGITGHFLNNTGNCRIDGFVEELKDSFPDMELVGVQSSLDQTSEVERIIVNTMTIYPDLKGIFLASGGQAGIRSAFETLRLQKRPFVIIYDLTPKNIVLLQDGVVDFLIDQNGYQQGYQALSLLADHLQWGIHPEQEYLYTEIRIETKFSI